MSTRKEQMMKPSRLSILEQEHSESIAVGLVIPSEIKKSEKDMYHVLLVNSDKVGLSEVRFRPRVQIYNSRAWEKVKKSIGNQGFAHVSVLHDPTVVEEVEAGKISFQELKNKASEDGMEVTPKTTKEEIEEFYKLEG